MRLSDQGARTLAISGRSADDSIQHRVRRGHSGQRHTRPTQKRQACRPECSRDQHGARRLTQRQELLRDPPPEEIAGRKHDR